MNKEKKFRPAQPLYQLEKFVCSAQQHASCFQRSFWHASLLLTDCHPCLCLAPADTQEQTAEAVATQDRDNDQMRPMPHTSKNGDDFRPRSHMCKTTDEERSESHPIVIEEHGRPGVPLADRAHPPPGGRCRRHGGRHVARRLRDQRLSQRRRRYRGAPVLHTVKGSTAQDTQV